MRTVSRYIKALEILNLVSWYRCDLLAGIKTKTTFALNNMHDLSAKNLLEST